ncbi:MAG: DUF4158 domain-containing protein [Oligoflexia bacterium]|nr:DUF4158 domain-containing protein [Oligoflexia bacterium]
MMPAQANRNVDFHKGLLFILLTKSELTLVEQSSLENFPQEITDDDLVKYFILSNTDMEQLPVVTQSYNRLGFAVQLCALRFLGFFPKNLLKTPPVILDFLANQLKIKTTNFNRYESKKSTHRSHRRYVIKYLKFKKLNICSRKNIAQWLEDRAMEHENTVFLIRLLCEKLLQEKIVRPGITTIEPMIAKARSKTWNKTYRIVCPIIKKNRSFIDDLLNSDEDKDNQFSWIKSSPVANSSNAIIETLERIEFLKMKGVYKWDLSKINPNRLKFLFDYGKRLSKYKLRRMPTRKRYSIAIVLLKMTIEKNVDDVIEQFDRNISDKHSSARRSLDDFIKDVSRSTNEKIWLLRKVGKIILDKNIKDSNIRKSIYKDMTIKQFRCAIEDCDRVIRPKDDNYFDFFSKFFSDIRKYSPRFLSALHFRSNIANNPILKNINFIKKYNRQGDQEELLNDAPLDAIPKQWKEYVIPEEGKINYRYYEMCTLWELRGAIRSGNIWVENSRKFTDPESYLISKNQWPSVKREFLKMVNLPENFSNQLEKKKKELADLLCAAALI